MVEDMELEEDLELVEVQVEDMVAQEDIVLDMIVIQELIVDIDKYYL